MNAHKYGGIPIETVAGTPKPEQPLDANTRLRHYWTGRAVEAENQVDQMTKELDKLTRELTEVKTRRFGIFGVALDPVQAGEPVRVVGNEPTQTRVLADDANHPIIDETGDEQSRQMEEQRARYAMYWELRNREQTRDVTLETLNRTGLIRTINELENQVMTERANGEYWERAGREARAHSRGAASEVDRLRALCDQGAKKIGDLQREKESLHGQLAWYQTYRTEPSGELDNLRLRLAGSNEACETLRAKLAQSEKAHEKTANKLADVINERDEARERTAELEQTLSIVRGDLATEERKRYEDPHPRYGKQALQAELGAAVHRATRAERKAAKANTELDAMRKHAGSLARALMLSVKINDGCQCNICVEARAALDYLKQPKE